MEFCVWISPATRGRALGSRTKPRVRARRKAQTIAEKYAGTLSKWSGSCGGNSDQGPKRKRWGSSINTYGRDSDHLDQRPAKQQRQQHVTNGPAEILWTRLKHLEPRRARRSWGGPKPDAITLTAKQIFPRESTERKTVESRCRASNRVAKETRTCEVTEKKRGVIVTPAQTACERACLRPAWRGRRHFHKADCLPILKASVCVCVCVCVCGSVSNDRMKI
jgi:hypothetical protein